MIFPSLLPVHHCRICHQHYIGNPIGQPCCHDLQVQVRPQHVLGEHTALGQIKKIYWSTEDDCIVYNLDGINLVNETALAYGRV